jgi:hypothetical protein
MTIQAHAGHMELEASPTLGADNRSVLIGLAGLDERRMDALAEAGVIGGAAG